MSLGPNACRRWCCLFVLLAALPAAGASEASAAGPYDWDLRSPNPMRVDGQALESGDSVRLVNATNSQAVVYGEREYGINLEWGDPGGANNVSLLAWPGTRGGFLRRGDRVALRVSGNSHLTYRVREYGINLSWSSEPAYEWEIRGSGGQFDGDDLVRSGDRIGLYNTRTDEYVVYGEREYGINLVWHQASGLPGWATADVLLTLRLGPFGTSRTCAGSVSWRFAPVRLTGGTGDSRRFVRRLSYSVRATRTGRRAYYCFISARTVDLRFGRWRVRLTPTPRAMCVVDRAAGGNLVNFAGGQAGCRTGAAFPG